MIDFIMNNSCSLLLQIKSNCDVFGPKFTEILDYVYTGIKISIPALIILLCTLDGIRAVTAQDEKQMKEAQSRTIKRIIIGMVIFFIPLLLGYLLDLIGLVTGTCKIGG